MTILEKLGLTPGRVRMLAFQSRVQSAPTVRVAKDKLPRGSREIITYAKANGLCSGEGTARKWEASQRARNVQRKYHSAVLREKLASNKRLREAGEA